MNIALGAGRDKRRGKIKGEYLIVGADSLQV
jgi:hypothetical protein